MALTDKLTAIGNAIRTKTGGTDLLTLDQMATEISNIPSGGGGDVSYPSALTSKISYWNTDGHNDWVVNLGQKIKITGKGGNDIERFFDGSSVEDASNMTFITKRPLHEYGFQGCSNLKKLPNFYCNNTGSDTRSFRSVFNGCMQLREIPNDFFHKKDENGNDLGELWFDQIATTNTAICEAYSNCYSLRELPDWKGLLFTVNNGGYMSVFNNCCALNKITDIPVPYSTSYTTTYNRFSSPFNGCYRVSEVKFVVQADGTPYPCSWKNQTIDCTYIGYAPFNEGHMITDYNSGITADKEVTDDATYQALKDDPDWFSADVNYSRYNHNSAVNTINSLPDTSAYLATAGGTNTIEFTGASGSKTDGGAINTLTEEEIAVATAKGWTVSFS